MNFQLRKFDMNRLANSGRASSIFIIGRHDSGKTFLVRDILFHIQHQVSDGLVVSLVDRDVEAYQSILPHRCVRDKYTPEIVKHVVKNSFLVLDDCLFDAKEFTKNEHMHELFNVYRHLKIAPIVTLGYPMSLPPMIQTNIDYTFIFRENITGNRKRLYENYTGIFPTFDMFCSFMDHCTANEFDCLVVWNNAPSNKLEDQVFWYKASDHPEFRMFAE